MPKKPRLGRPPLRDAERRKHIMSIRVRPKLRDEIQAAAEKSGRTLSQEVEHHLERAFDPDKSPASADDVRSVAVGMAQMAGVMMRSGEHYKASDKPEDQEAVRALRMFASLLLKALPEKEPSR